MEPLYRRVELLETFETRGIKKSLEEILPSERIDPTHYLAGERYYQKRRDELSYIISTYLANRGTKIEKGFANKLYHSFTPKKGYSRIGSTHPFLEILYGRVLADKLSDEIFKQLYDFEAAYFLEGLWAGNSGKHWKDKFTYKNIHAWNFKKIIGWTIKQGVKKLQKYEKTTGKKLPRKDKILKSCDEAMDTQMGLF